MAFIDFEKSLDILADIELSEANIIEIGLIDSLGYVLASDIVAYENSPSEPTSAMDGYAFIHEDGIEKLKISGINPAGSENSLSVKKGECIKTFTGSLMPNGSDTLIPIENVKVVDDEIEIFLPVKKGSNVRAVGENYAKNELLIPCGTKIDFPQIGVMASLNISKVKVYKKPIVGIFATGSELLDIGEEQILPSQIRSSNHLTVEAITKKYGGEPLQFGCIKDDKESIMKMLTSAVEKSDIVVTTGGVSVGDYDFVKDVIREIGFEVLFQGVNLKPGQHIMLAQKGDKFILGLPGFAYSSTVTALLYLLPLMGKFCGTTTHLQEQKALLTQPYIKKSKKTEFVACDIRVEYGTYLLSFDSKKEGTSAILTNLLGNTALMRLKPNDTSLQAGDEVTILLF